MSLCNEFMKRVIELKKKIEKKYLTNRENETKMRENIQKIVSAKPKQLDTVRKEYIIQEKIIRVENIDSLKRDAVETLRQVVNSSNVPRVDKQKERKNAIEKLRKIKNRLANIDLMCNVESKKDIDFVKKYLDCLLVEINDEKNKEYLEEKIKDSYNAIYLKCKQNLENIKIYEQMCCKKEAEIIKKMK